MLELNEHNVIPYLRDAGRASGGEILVQSLSGGVANVVLKIFDTGGGEQLAPADPASPRAGNCFVLKQPLPKFKTSAEWLVDIDRVHVERDCMQLLAELLPQDSVPQVLWFDESNYILAISCAPTGSVIWKKALLEGQASMDAATHAGMLLAMMHSSTQDEPAVKQRYGDPLFFIQQRIDPYLRHAAARHPGVQDIFENLARQLLHSQLCLIHGDFSPKNIFLVPHRGAMADELRADPQMRNQFPLSHLLLLDFEVAFYGHPVFDVATLINHLTLKAFYHGSGWRPLMLMADTFWQTYRTTADPRLVSAVNLVGAPMLGALLLARVDGKSPAEYITAEPLKEKIRQAGLGLVRQHDLEFEAALDTVSTHLAAVAD